MYAVDNNNYGELKTEEPSFFCNMVVRVLIYTTKHDRCATDNIKPS